MQDALPFQWNAFLEKEKTTKSRTEKSSEKKAKKKKHVGWATIETTRVA